MHENDGACKRERATEWAPRTGRAGVDRTPLRTDGGDLLRADLPNELRTALGRFVDRGPVSSLEEWVSILRRHVNEGTITVEALCHTDEPSPHRGIVDGETFHFACFYDAVILAAIRMQPVEIRTESPGGRIIEARADGAGRLTIRPETAVFSFGVAADVEPAIGPEGLDHERGYAAICPYVRAFPDRDAYERWASAVDAPTVAVPLDGATELAGALVGPDAA